MAVVNCKVKFLRPEYDNLHEWMNDTSNVYIGRAGIVFIRNKETNRRNFPKSSSIFANPFKVGKDGSRETVIKKYKQYMTAKLEKDNTLVQQLLAMKGKNLGCWCHPNAHGDVLLDLIQLYDDNKDEKNKKKKNYYEFLNFYFFIFIFYFFITQNFFKMIFLRLLLFFLQEA